MTSNNHGTTPLPLSLPENWNGCLIILYYADGIKSFKAIMTWWQDMAMQSKRFDKQPGTCLQFISTSMSSSKVERGKFSLGFSSKSM